MIQDTLTSRCFQQWGDIPPFTQQIGGTRLVSLQFSARISSVKKIQILFGQMLTSSILVVKIARMLGKDIGLHLISKIQVLPTQASHVVAKLIKGFIRIYFFRKIAQALRYWFIYPNPLFFVSDISRISLDEWQQGSRMNAEDFECRRIALTTWGAKYDAFAVGHPSIKGNGQWVIIADGEHKVANSGGAVYEIAQYFQKLGLNTLYVNALGRGQSRGRPTNYYLGAGQEAGLQLLEEVIKARKILIYGHSIGAGIQAKAILEHEFKKDVHYMVWSNCSFDTLSHVVSDRLIALVKLLFSFLGVELDAVAGAKKLQKLGITHIVTQGVCATHHQGILPLEQATEGMILNKASLYNGIIEAKIQDAPRIKCYGMTQAVHWMQPKEIEQLIGEDIRAFLAIP